jgi:glyoxylase-like metal-dependent hydrolase (beta-lactamase superfamily II)
MTSLQLTSTETADFGHGDVYFIGNATTLIRFGGLTILTDPAFLHKGEHVYLGHGIWARRDVEPACQIADLPPIDLIVLSHYHGDHFDDVAAQKLDIRLPRPRRDLHIHPCWMSVGLTRWRPLSTMRRTVPTLNVVVSAGNSL